VVRNDRFMTTLAERACGRIRRLLICRSDLKIRTTDHWQGPSCQLMTSPINDQYILGLHETTPQSRYLNFWMRHPPAIPT